MLTGKRPGEQAKYVEPTSLDRQANPEPISLELAVQKIVQTLGRIPKELKEDALTQALRKIAENERLEEAAMAAQAISV